ncbi:MAG: peptidoglycan DD-metalloendopeptidase family protein [Fibrobacter sp.]|jgi:septal ring factor EnvC (AmiA/AmiB activator)|uniref:murein hydrolase activator EnvC family protein n=1 Tax=unclassified Fibrobacter TaxID=2634177 RepID=UPI0009208EEB|nr:MULTISPECIES: peptidoglycan DD-metalloendopeptidase family protein [unclassified Fibrobacter]MBQ3719914.1 peptidoglycan DD-metalloendopeptidase family protein [Fibrobacter sp.]MBR2059819.1 peptidoglycan DD-metalloendopeptidase family protein [Fibrobacter sp.]MBR2308070.1 peptidoglycan DD-metalloendopeptidase family protein [Fibrobacter sp.]MBR4006159.1 peptidoglycan DD-metalloendopeptidase family protein [Fibrobacter sp.]SHH06792.1 Septal ring factor EnvC, activator of murein hydrolases Ami
MRLLVVFLCLLVGLAGAAPKKTDAQIKEQRNALKKLESDLAKKREELVLLETEEKGVLNTISLLDQNLNQTRVYITELSKNEKLVQQAVEQLKRDIDSLDQKIHVRKEAMKVRVRKLYVNGRYSEAEVLYRLLSREGDPRRQAYWVHHVLNEDRMQVEILTAMVTERDEKKRESEEHLVELNGLREKKAREEKGLVSQMGNQERMLLNLKHDKAMQQRALQEFERNQKVMQALIAKLEAKRKKEIEEAKKAEAARKAKQKKQKEKKVVEKPKKTIAGSVKGPKCMPLEGEIISNYGLQEHPVLHIATRNLGVEIRGKRGAAIRAAAAGTVVMVAEIDGRGPSVIIEHEGGTYSVYGHLRSIRVQEGKEVRNCEEIGEAGDIASLNGIKLYFQVSEGTQTVDPLQWLKTK